MSPSTPPSSTKLKKDVVPQFEITVRGIYTRGASEESSDGSESGKRNKFVRRRMNTGPLRNEERADVEPLQKEDGTETATFVPERGLVDASFYHSYAEDDYVYEERAVLFQSTEHYAHLAADPATRRFFVDPNTSEPVLDRPGFGEQVVVSGCDASQISIGDVFEAEGSALRVEVTSPRLCAEAVDGHHESPGGALGVSRRANAAALGGWFARVLVAGELREGARMVRVARPHPKWTLRHVNRVLYLEGTEAQVRATAPSWNRGMEELRELCALPQLGGYDWGDPAWTILKRLVKEQDRVATKERAAFRRTYKKPGYGGIWKFLSQPFRSSEKWDTKTTKTNLEITIRGVYAPDEHAEGPFKTRRLKTRSDAESPETPTFVPGHGLVSASFFHNRAHGPDDNYIYEERAILFQSTEHYALLAADPDARRRFAEPPVLDRPRFGEQVVVSGIDASRLAVGDVFRARGSPLEVEVTSPRLCCHVVDDVNGTPYGPRGLKHRANAAAAGGWFVRVLTAGALREETTMVRVAHPHPKWTLAYLNDVLYQEGTRLERLSKKATWNREVEELRELCALPQLGGYEWGNPAWRILKRKMAEKEEGTFVPNGATTGALLIITVCSMVSKYFGSNSLEILSIYSLQDSKHFFFDTFSLLYSLLFGCTK